MEAYTHLKHKIRQRIEILEETIQKLDGLGMTEAETTRRWGIHLAKIRRSLEDFVLRIAVVGSVKSGKSTLINALVGSDLLRRGAGIVTAFVTRIRVSDQLGGWVELKPWGEVLEELNEAARMLPDFDRETNGDSIDIRNAEERQRLREHLERVRNEWQQIRGHVDPSFLATKAYLDGYDLLKDSMGESVNRLLFDPSSITRHHRFVGTQGQEVYIRDMELQVPISWLGENVEIADCQGSDSPNPLHFARLQQHLLGTHLVLYVISSRHGLREADFKLLEFIKTIGLDPHTLFILNTDLDVHPDREDIEAMCRRVKGELEWLVPNPRLYHFSALYHLGEQVGGALGEKERRLLRHWKKEKLVVKESSENFLRFREHLGGQIQLQRVATLLRSILNRLSLVAGSVLETVKTRKVFLDQDLEELRNSAQPLEEKHSSMQGMLQALQNSISGLRETLVRELDRSVDAFFHPTNGKIVPQTLEVVEGYPVDPYIRKELTDFRQAFRRLYRVYLEFREGVTRYLVDRINLQVIEFAREQEAYVETHLRQAYESLFALFQTAVEEYRNGLAQYGIRIEKFEGSRGWDGSIPRQFRPDSFSAAAGRDSTRRGVLLLKFGLGRLSGWLGELRASSPEGRGWGKLCRCRTADPEVLQEAVALIKDETKSELLHSFSAYAREFKTRYLWKVLEQGVSQLQDEFAVRSAVAGMDLTQLVSRSEAAGKDRMALLEALIQTEQVLQAMMEELNLWSVSVP